MKQTSVLDVVYSQHIPRDRLIIHPNAGFDLGMMNTCHQVQWCSGVEAKEFLLGKAVSGEEIQVNLRNDCPPAQLQVHIRHRQILGGKPKAVIFCDGNRIFIHSV